MKKFAFLVHPRDISDMARPLPWLKYVPSKLTEEIIKRLTGRLGFIVWSKFNVYDRVEGWIILVSLTGEQIMFLPRKYVQNRILDAVLWAQDVLGVDLIGLGAYTAPITDAGRWLAGHDRVRVNITHGDSFSVAIAFDGIKKLAERLKRPLLGAKVAVVGAYGLIGSALTQLLMDKCKALYLVGRNLTKLNVLCDTLNAESTEILPTLQIEEAKNCDFIITATSYAKSLLQSQHLKEGAVVYDIAQPINLSPQVLKTRPDVLRVDGCYVKTPRIDSGVDMGPPPGVTFSCFAETIMQALEGEKANYVGKIKLSHVEKTKSWADKYNFSHAEFTNYNVPLVL